MNKRFATIIFWLTLVLAPIAIGQSTTNNTSACSANGVPTVGCNGVGIMPFLGNGANVGLQTTTVDPLPTNVSTVSAHSLLYTGATTRTIMEYQPWFCNSSSPCNGHKVNGMQEVTAAQILNQAQFMKTVGGDVTVVDYYGCSFSCPIPQLSAQAYNLSVTTALAAAIGGSPSTTPKFMIMLDAGAINATGTGQCPPAGGDQSACLIAAINTQMDYIATNWLYQSYYETNATNGHPIVLYFIGHGSSGDWPGTDFNIVFGGVAAHATAGNSCGGGCTYTTTVDFVDENAGGFTETGVAGAYAWPQPTTYSITNQFCWQGNACFGYLADFYSHARSNPSKIAIGVIYKGFDDKNAGWGSNRVIAQECGQVLNLTANSVGTAGYNSGSQLQYVQFATWNDYEEASEVETGVDNCITIGTPTIAAGNISWTLIKSDPTYASTGTIKSFSIYTGVSSPTSLYASGISPAVTTFTAPSLSGQKAWVYMVGGPLIQNRLSPPVTLPVAPALPAIWVDNNEGNVALTAPTYTITFPTAGSGGSWTCGVTNYGPYTAGSQASLQTAVNNAEACRTANAGVPKILLKVPPALYTTSNALGLVIPQSSTTLSSGFIAIVSTQDANLPIGQTICSHGVQDNLTTSTDIGLNNPDCAGDVMSFQLGTIVTTVPVGAFTLANGTVTNTSAYNDVQFMYTLESSGTNPSALTFCSPLGISSSSHPPLCAATTIGPDHWLIEDTEVRMQAGNTGNQFVLDLQLAGNETNIAQLSSHIHLRKVWVHGDWTSLTAGANSVASDIEFDCIYCSVVDSQTSESLRPGGEGHSLTAQGQGPFKFNHNWLEGQASGIFSGGFSVVTPFTISGYMPFQDVEIRRNRLTFPYAWLGVLTIPGGNTHWAGSSIDRKNALETKNAARLLEDGNIIENSDNSGGQSGVLADWNARQFRTNYQNTVQDVTITNNLFRNGCEGIEFANSAPSQGNGGGIAFNERRILLSNNLFYNLTAANPGCIGVLSVGLNTSNSGWIFQGTVTENSAGTAATFTPTCSASGGSNGTNGGDCPGQVSGSSITAPGTGCVAGNLTIGAPPPGGIQAAGTYSCSGGALSAVVITNEGLNYPSAPTATIATGTGTLTLTIFTVPGGLIAGSEVMDFSIGDPIPVYNCPNVTAFNLPLTNYTTGSFYWPNILGPKASAVNNTIGSTSVTFPVVATANASDTSGYCTVITTQGGPQNFYAIHNTFITNSTILPTSNNTAGPGPNFAMNWEMQNNIFLSLTAGTAWNSNRGEGNPTEQFNYNIPSMTADHNVWPGRNGAVYTAYGNNTAFPVASPVMYFPVNAGAVGFSCVGCATVVPLTLADYHGFSLLLASPYHNTGSDGTDIGVNLSPLDLAETKNLFVCSTVCGSPGPFPDVPLSAPISTITITGGHIVIKVTGGGSIVVQ